MPKISTPHTILTKVPPYNAFTDFTPTLPKLYWDVYSQEERIKAICFAIDKIIKYADFLGIELNKDTEEILKLREEFDEFKEGAFDDYYIELLTNWINDNMANIIRQSIKMVFFGLTSDGYFCAYIPESWSDITFDTGMVYGTQAYGRLILQYDVDGTGVLPSGTVTVDQMIINAIKDYEEEILNANY